MGKKPANRKNNKKNNKKNKNKLTNKEKLQQNVKNIPFVSICTPTFNRRPFIPFAIDNYLSQDYPREKLEWIIIDDGNDKVGDLLTDISGVRYFSYDEKMTLGKKRNLMHDKSKGDIIVYMDDDDYYPPERVSHAVSMLTKNKHALCSGSSRLHIWYNEFNKVYEFGPYGKNHATAGTFAFKRELLLQTRYNEEASLAEEKEFLKNYTIPFVQLDPMKTILVFSHSQNTCDKKKFITNPLPKYVKETSLTVDSFIPKERIKSKEFILGVEEQLSEYELGTHKYKPDVVSQLKRMEEKRKEQQNEMLKNNKNIEFTRKDEQGNNVSMSAYDIKMLIDNQQKKLQQMKQLMDRLNILLNEKDKTIDELKNEISTLKSQQNSDTHEEETTEEETNEEETTEEVTNEETTE